MPSFDLLRRKFFWRYMRWCPGILTPARVRFSIGKGGQGWRARLACLTYATARDNHVSIGRNVRVGRLRIMMRGKRNRLEIGDDCRLQGFISIDGDGTTVKLGNGFDAKGVKIVAWHGDLTVGDGCLLADGIEIRSGDIHRIFDAETDEILNPPGHVRIGDRVWIGAYVSVLKGAAIADDSLVGTRSVVTRAFEEPGVALAGAPARIVRRGIRWER